MALAPRRMRRDVSRIQDRLVASGRAVWVGQEWQAGGYRRQESDVERAAARVRALLFGEPVR
jgi:hypothetical protein